MAVDDGFRTSREKDLVADIENPVQLKPVSERSVPGCAYRRHFRAFEEFFRAQRIFNG